jgi:DNA-binding transcriptional regulator YhcF (GntR family)
MKLFLNRDSGVPLHDQLVAQVGQLVAAGQLAPGERLPSIRGLASRLGVHHLTVLAAYRTLAGRGVLTIREGSGVRVAALTPPSGGWREGVALTAMARYFVEQARSRGHRDDAILDACRAALAPGRVERLVVVNPHPDLQALYMHELQSVVDLPIEARTPEEIEVAGPAQFADACILTSTNFAAPLGKLLGDDRPLVIFRLASTEPLLARARELPDDALVAVASRSPRFVFLFRELLSGVLPQDRLLGCELSAPKARALLRQADLVVTETASAADVKSMTRAPVIAHRLLADDVAASLAPHLPPEAFRLEVTRSRRRAPRSAR